jgi:hypothetical protein
VTAATMCESERIPASSCAPNEVSIELGGIAYIITAEQATMLMVDVGAAIVAADLPARSQPAAGDGERPTTLSAIPADERVLRSPNSRFSDALRRFLALLGAGQG